MLRWSFKALTIWADIPITVFAFNMYIQTTCSGKNLFACRAFKLRASLMQLRVPMQCLFGWVFSTTFSTLVPGCINVHMKLHLGLHDSSIFTMLTLDFLFSVYIGSITL